MGTRPVIISGPGIDLPDESPYIDPDERAHDPDYQRMEDVEWDGVPGTGPED